MKAQLVKTVSGMLPFGVDSETWYKKKKLGVVVEVETVEVRNPGFHRKFFALLNLGFGYWEPGEVTAQHGIPEKNFKRFRKDVTILAGYHHTVIRLDGTARVEADSISFARMEQDVFEELYSNVLDVLLNRIPMLKKMGAEETNRAVNKMLEFA